MIFEIADHGPESKTMCNVIAHCELHVSEFYVIWHSEQIEHANYEYINWN